MENLIQLAVEKLGVWGWCFAGMFVVGQLGKALYNALVAHRDSERKDVEHCAQLPISLNQSLTDNQRWFYAEVVHDRHFRARTKMMNVSSDLRETMLAFMCRHPELLWEHLRRLSTQIECVDSSRIRIRNEAAVNIISYYGVAMFGALTWTFFGPLVSALFHEPTNASVAVQFGCVVAAWIAVGYMLARTYVMPAFFQRPVIKAIKKDRQATTEAELGIEPTVANGRFPTASESV